MLVPESLATASSAWKPAERMSWPGAVISTLLPKLEKEAKVSSMVLAPTVMALGTRAGETLFASWVSFPAATTKGTPLAMALFTCGREGDGDACQSRVVGGSEQREFAPQSQWPG
jgi:hypothetical protein